MFEHPSNLYTSAICWGGRYPENADTLFSCFDQEKDTTSDPLISQTGYRVFCSRRRNKRILLSSAGIEPFTPFRVTARSLSVNKQGQTRDNSTRQSSKWPAIVFNRRQYTSPVTISSSFCSWQGWSPTHGSNHPRRPMVLGLSTSSVAADDLTSHRLFVFSLSWACQPVSVFTLRSGVATSVLVLAVFEFLAGWLRLPFLAITP